MIVTLKFLSTWEAQGWLGILANKGFRTLTTKTSKLSHDVANSHKIFCFFLKNCFLFSAWDIFWENQAISDKARKWPTQIFLIFIYIIHIIVKSKTLKFFSLKLYGLGVWAQQNSHLKEKKYSFFTDMGF